jgi:hypothetical protein
MEISDAQFNMLYSLPKFSSMIFPALVAILYSKFGMRALFMTSGLCCCLGQAMFAYGLQQK